MRGACVRAARAFRKTMSNARALPRIYANRGALQMAQYIDDLVQSYAYHNCTSLTFSIASKACPVQHNCISFLTIWVGSFGLERFLVALVRITGLLVADEPETVALSRRLPSNIPEKRTGSRFFAGNTSALIFLAANGRGGCLTWYASYDGRAAARISSR
jgi:hypothetical protein